MEDSPPTNNSSSPPPTVPLPQLPQISKSPISTPVPNSPSPNPKTASSLWSNLFKSSPNENPYPPPTFLDDGTPVVQAPPHIILSSSATWKDHLIASFFGTPPPPHKIFSDLNPIWGRNGAISVRQFSEGTCLIFIPSLSTREWVLEVGFWSAGTVGFSVSEWTPSPQLHNRSLTSAPLWISLLSVPPQLWSLEGVKLISSGVGKPIPSPRPKPLPHSLGPVKTRVLVDLRKPLPLLVAVTDSEGNSVRIGIEYLNLPPRCSACSHFGHQAHRCPLPPPSKAAVKLAAALPSSSAPSQPLVESSKPPASSPPAPSSPAGSSGISEAVVLPCTDSAENPNRTCGTALDILSFPPLSPVHLQKPKPKPTSLSKVQLVASSAPALPSGPSRILQPEYIKKRVPLAAQPNSLLGPPPSYGPSGPLAQIPLMGFSPPSSGPSSPTAPPPLVSQSPTPPSSAVLPPPSVTQPESPLRPAASPPTSVLTPDPPSSDDGSSPPPQKLPAASPSPRSSSPADSSFVSLLLHQHDHESSSPLINDLISSPLLTRPLLKALLRSPPHLHFSRPLRSSPNPFAVLSDPVPDCVSESDLVLSPVSDSSVHIDHIDPALPVVASTKPRSRSSSSRSLASSKPAKSKPRDSRKARTPCFPPSRRVFLL